MWWNLKKNIYILKETSHHLCVKSEIDLKRVILSYGFCHKIGNSLWKIYYLRNSIECWYLAAHLDYNQDPIPGTNRDLHEELTWAYNSFENIFINHNRSWNVRLPAAFLFKAVIVVATQKYMNTKPPSSNNAAPWQITKGMCQKVFLRSNFQHCSTDAGHIFSNLNNI